MFEHHKKESPILSLAGMGGGAASYIFYSASGGGEVISRSVRLSDNSHLRRTHGSSGNRKTWTLSFWAKFCGGAGHILSSGNDAFQMELRSDGRFLMKNDGCFSNTYSTHEYRDYAAWYHFVLEHDATNTYFKLHVNGELHQTITATNANGAFNGNTVHGWNGRSTSNDSLHDFYLANVEFVDGSALAPTNFGEYDSYSVWQPKAYSGSYGTNGYKLAFSNTSSYTSVGNDSAGSNNWTPTKIKAKDYDYAGDITFYSASSLPFNNQQRIFDGTAASDATIANGECWVEFNPTTPIPYTSSVEVMGSGSPNSPYNLRWILNDGTAVNGVNANSYVSLASGSGTINKIRGQVAAGGFNLRAIRVDGVILSDFSSSIDVVRDSPSNSDSGTGNSRGNYPILNHFVPHQVSNDSFADGNLKVNFTSSSAGLAPSTWGFSSGKWYYEYYPETIGTGIVGLRRADSINYDNSYMYLGNGNKSTNGGGGSSYGNSWGDGDVIGVAVDMDNGTLTFYKNGTSEGQAFSGISGEYTFCQGTYSGASSGSYSVNFGQQPFHHSVPTGYLPLCSKNRSAEPVADSTTGFKALAYDGDGNATKALTGMGHSPDFVWITQTSSGGWQHVLYDRNRGAGTNSVVRSLSSNDDRTEAQGNDTNHGYLSAFGTDGVTLTKGSQGGGDYVNHNGWNYLAYSWEGADSTTTSNAGEVTSTCRVNPTTQFSIVTWTANTPPTNVGHGMVNTAGAGIVPEFIIFKSRTVEQSWQVGHHSVGWNDRLILNGNQGKETTVSAWNNTAPTTTTFNVGNTSIYNGDMVAYCWRGVEGYSKFSAYTGSGNEQFVYLGFTPAWLMIKRYTDNTVGQWTIYDTANSPTNEVTKKLWADSAGGEEDHTNNSIDIVSNGFVLDPGSDSGNVQYTNNGSVGYIYAAFAEHPMSSARAR